MTDAIAIAAIVAAILMAVLLWAVLRLDAIRRQPAEKSVEREVELLRRWMQRRANLHGNISIPLTAVMVMAGAGAEVAQKLHEIRKDDDNGDG